MAYLKNLAAKKVVGNEGTLMQYHHNFNNASISWLGSSHSRMGLLAKNDPKGDKNFNTISNVILKNRKCPLFG